MTHDLSTAITARDAACAAVAHAAEQLERAQQLERAAQTLLAECDEAHKRAVERRVQQLAQSPTPPALYDAHEAAERSAAELDAAAAKRLREQREVSLKEARGDLARAEKSVTTIAHRLLGAEAEALSAAAEEHERLAMQSREQLVALDMLLTEAGQPLPPAVLRVLQDPPPTYTVELLLGAVHHLGDKHAPHGERIAQARRQWEQRLAELLARAPASQEAAA